MAADQTTNRLLTVVAENPMTIRGSKIEQVRDWTRITHALLRDAPDLEADLVAAIKEIRQLVI